MRRSAMTNNSRGPLMTDHLQDLELELELLKRKRQLIQQQQDMIYQPHHDRPNRYNQPSQLYNDRFNEPAQRNFSHLYDDTPARGNTFERPMYKRRADEIDWQPPMSSTSNHYDGPHNKKPRPGPAPFSDRFPVQNKKVDQTALLSMPKPLMSFKPQGPRRPPPSHIKPKQIQGKYGVNSAPRTNFKQKYNAPNKLNNYSIKESKDAVAKATDLVQNKTNEFVLLPNENPSPKLTGRLELALGMILKQIKLEFGDKEAYKLIFSTQSFLRVLKEGIRKRIRNVMLGKNVGVANEILAQYRKEYPKNTDIELVQLAEAEKLKHVEKRDLAIVLLEEGHPEEYFKKNMTRLLNVKLNEMFTKIKNVYKEELKMSTQEVIKGLPEPEAIKIETVIVEENGTMDTKNDTAQNCENIAKEEKPVTKEVYYNKLMEQLLHINLPKLLPNFKNEIIKTLNIDEMYKSTKAAIILDTNERASNTFKVSCEVKSVGDTDLPKNWPYYVKVYGSPQIPKRKIMQEFLNKFNPKTIKKHKKIHNLLFIGFNEKTDFDNILAANRTVLGNSKLYIKKSENTKSDNHTKEDSDDGVVIIEDREGDILANEILTPALDNQIDDLLSSIRKADEEAKAKNDEDTVLEVVNENLKPNGNEHVVIQDLTKDDVGDESTKNNECENEQNIIKDQKEDNTVVTKNNNSESNDEPEIIFENHEGVIIVEDDKLEKEDLLEAVKDKEQETAATPTRASARLATATPNTIVTRRASRLAQNN